MMIFYEERPYLYMVGGLIATLFYKQSTLALCSGLLLIACGIWVYILRRTHRNQNVNLGNQHNEFTKKVQENKKNKI